jgi:hypothetical protein
MVVNLPSLNTLYLFSDRAYLPIFQKRTAKTNIATVPANSSPRTAGLTWAFTLIGGVYGPFGGRGGDGVKE